MWIENNTGTIINGNSIKKIYVTESTNYVKIYTELYTIGYLDNKNQSRCLFENISKKNAEIIYENLKTLLKVNMNFASKEQLLEGTNL